MTKPDIIEVFELLFDTDTTKRVEELITNTIDADHDYSLLDTEETWNKERMAEDILFDFTGDCQDALENVVKEWQKSLERKQL